MFSSFLKYIKDFLKDLGFEELIAEESWQVDSVILLLLVGLLTSLATGIYRLIEMWVKHRQHQKLKSDLHPYFSSAVIKKATSNYVETNFQSNPPSQHSELIQAHKVTARQPLIPFFLKQAFKKEMDNQRFYIILAGSGMGKTTFMINLYMRYIRKLPFGRQAYHIKLMPLGYHEILKKIGEIPDQENTILLLDGLDEDPQAIRNHQKRIERIVKKVRDFRIVIFTCRTQFFPSAVQEPKETGVVKFGSQQGFETFAKMYLSPFNEKDIKRFLDKKYGRFLSPKKQKALQIVAQSPNLIVRPMILSYIDDLLETKQRYTYSSHLYEALIQKWIDREAQRVDSNRRESFRAELYRFSRAVAIDIYNNRRHRKGLFISQKDIKPLADKHHIKLKEMEMKSRSLLNRDVLGQYKFAHKSILEYFLAVEAIKNPNFGRHFNFDGMDQALVFYNELCLSNHSLPLFKESAGKGHFQVEGGKKKDLGEVKEQELKHIQRINFFSIKDLAPLRPLKSVNYLQLDETEIEDIYPISVLSKLEELHLRKTKVHDLSPLVNLEELKALYLDYSQVETITPLKQLPQLKILSIGNTVVENLRPLFDLRALHHLNLQHTKVKDLNPIRHLHHLTFLSFQHTDVNALNPIRGLESLEHLSVGFTPIKTLTPLQSMHTLKFLSLPRTPITSIAPLAALHQLQKLNMSECKIEDISPLPALTQLRHLNLRKTPVKDFSPLMNMQSIESLVLERTAFEDTKVLKKIPDLKEIDLRNTNISTIKPLMNSTKLQRIQFSMGSVPEREIKQLQEALPSCKVEVK